MNISFIPKIASFSARNIEEALTKSTGLHPGLLENGKKCTLGKGGFGKVRKLASSDGRSEFAVKIGIAAAEAIKSLHDSGMIYRDLKPDAG